jgi:hypothetical protein
MKTLKVVTLEGTFPECYIKNMYQTGRGQGTNIRVAAANAMRDLLKNPGLRGKRITAAKITMSVGTINVEDKTTLEEAMKKPTGY